MLGRRSEFAGQCNRLHWKLGAEPGVFKTLRALGLDLRARLMVGDHGNNNLQLLAMDRNCIEQFKQYSRSSSMSVLDDDTIVVADLE